VSITFTIIENPIRNPNALKGNKPIKNASVEGSKHITKIIAGANIIAVIIVKNIVPPKIILIVFILFVLICYSINIIIINDIKKSGVIYF
jgi:hypothetical protein